MHVSPGAVAAATQAMRYTAPRATAVIRQVSRLFRQRAQVYSRPLPMPLIPGIMYTVFS